MTGAQRLAILVAMAGASGACEALVGITDRQQAAPPDGGNDATGAGDTGAADGPPGDETRDGEPQDDAMVDGDATGSDTTASPDAGADGDAATAPPGDGGDGGDARNAADALDAMNASDGFDPDPDLPCSGQAVAGPVAFCDDFDTSSTPGQGWDYTYLQGDGGVLQIDTVDWVSSPKSAQVVVPVVSGTVTSAQMGKTLSPFSAGVRLALDYRVDMASYGGLPQVCVAQLYVHQGTGAQAQINFNVGPGSSARLEAYPPDAGTALTVVTSPPPLATWTRVVVSYAADGTVILSENGQVLGSVQIGGGAAGTAQIIAGAPFVNPNGTQTPKIEIDNVVVRAQ